MNYTLRLATQADIPSMSILAGEFLGAAGLPCGFDQKHWIATWSKYLATGIGMAIVAVDDNGEVLGGIGGHPHPDTNDGKQCLAEAFWFVSEKHRKSRIGLELINSFEGWATLHGFVRVTMVRISGFNERLGKFYEKRGYKPTEIHYTKRL